MRQRDPDCRFAILEHTPGECLRRDGKPVERHFDWLLETEGVAQTFATAPCEITDGTWSVEARRLEDHRLHYFDFEGDIGGGRGVVRQVAKGNYQIIDETRKWLIISVRCSNQSHQQIDATITLQFV